MIFKGRFTVIAFLLFWLSSSSFCVAQSNVVDSLQQQLSKTNDAWKRLQLLLELCSRNDLDADSYDKYSVEAMRLSEKVGTTKQKSLAVYYMAWYYYLQSENDSARMVIDKELKNLSAPNVASQDVYFKLKNFKATTYQGERNYAKALEVLYPLLDEEQKFNNDFFAAYTMQQIAVIESRQGNTQKSIQWNKQALTTLPKDNPSYENVLATIYSTLGKSYEQMSLPDSAVYYNDKAITLFREASDSYNLAISLQYQASIYIKQKRKEEAGKTLSELKSLNDKTHVSDGDLNYSLTLIDYYMLNHEYDKAITFCKERLAIESKITIRASYYERLAECYKAIGLTAEYADVLEQIIAARDTIAQINSADAIAEMQTKYEVQKKENTIIAQQLNIIRKNVLLISSLALVLVVVVVAWFLFRRSRRRNKIKMLLMQEEEKRNALIAVKDARENERKRIAADLHDSLGSYAASIKANADELLQESHLSKNNLELLQTNSQQMVSLLADTIWALRKNALYLTDISDRIKVFLQRLRYNYPSITLKVEERLEEDVLLSPVHAFHLFMIVQEAVNNAIRHSEGNEVIVSINGGEQWSLSIRDNGKGLLSKDNLIYEGNGKHNMKERASSMECVIEWNTVQPRGTEVKIYPSNTI